MQHLPRMSAAYGFMANPAGLSPQLSQPVPAGVPLQSRHTLLPAGPIAAHATPKLLVSLQAHMFPAQFGLTPGWHEKHSLLRATPVLSLSSVGNTVVLDLECKAGPAWYQLFCKVPTISKHQKIICASQQAAVPHCLCKVLLLTRTLCTLCFVLPTPICTEIHSGSIYLTVVSVCIVCRGRTLLLVGQEEAQQVSHCGQASLSRAGLPLPQLWGHREGSLPQGRQAEVAPLCLTPLEPRTAPSPR